MLSRISLWVATAALSVSSATAAWTPSSTPIPTTVLREAQADFKAGRYEDALDRHVWYHDNALKFDKGQAGVRLSYALISWVELGKAYPPAKAKLKAIQDGLEKQLAQGKGDFQLFHDFYSINRAFNEGNRTTAVFVALDEKNPELAKRVFQAALPALVSSQEYTLCGKYIKAEQFYQKAVESYRVTLKIESDNPALGKTNFAKQYFTNTNCLLVALLVKNNRLDEAKKVAADAAKEFDDADFKAKLEKALKGEVPPPWP